MPTRRHAAAARGFTLVELLVVMGIIALLVSLLLPAVNYAFTLAATLKSKQTINSLSVSLEAFRGDFGAYPPSDDEHEPGFARKYGYVNLSLFLMGPDGRGWGGGSSGGSAGMPFDSGGGGATERRFGPYYTSEDLSGALGGVSDAFKPVKKILYYRADEGAQHVFDIADNPTDDAGESGFKDQAHLNLLVMRGTGAAARPVNPNYVLISPGPDRRYGHVKETTESGVAGVLVPATVSDNERMCDDVTNFKY